MEERKDILGVLRRTLELVGSSEDSPFSELTASAVSRKIKKALKSAEAGRGPGVLQSLSLTYMFAPTGPIQEISLFNGWAEEFLSLAAEVDTQLESPSSRASGDTESKMRQMANTCPCCGYRTLAGPPGSHAICEICFWEDDLVQLTDPEFEGGANEASLVVAQENYKVFGACEKHVSVEVRKARPGEERDPLWRPLKGADLKRARKNESGEIAEGAEIESAYYWKKDAT